MNISDTFGDPPLIHCVKEQNLELIEFVLSQSTKVDTKESNGMTALMHASLLGNEEIVTKLLEKGADPNIRDKKNMTATLHAACHGKKKIIVILKKAGDKTDIKEINGAFLIYLAKKGDVKNVQRLLQKGADVNFADSKRWTPLICAAHYGRIEVVKELLKLPSVLVNAQAAMKTTALHHSAREGHADVVEQLVSHNADINLQDNLGFTPLFYAKDELTAQKLLLFKDKIDFSLKNNDGLNALDFHKKKKNSKIVEALENLQ
ncbi:ankyrin repeat ph and sec7 domain containing protein secg-related [Anaeramoeba ignava]|uniref:Ankyrin repeat ph and sec7 domain containing protein secg-related n=1 Tax=Anaeramoeba ignava TaxID=1746090 RepID=A0A9Q0RG47_ANAIG|nr:ankyrin repeat ph and sec7 domain containing protein secg-related [Anaeramoeba ignava]|eukprot:Anaeramoba_ignava/a92179_113.p1 GENE.a92179_113~~a92179_113.p1  ORF type:complete len:262 (+),score=58.53 a92179_113:40-825(+)